MLSSLNLILIYSCFSKKLIISFKLSLSYCDFCAKIAIISSVVTTLYALPIANLLIALNTDIDSILIPISYSLGYATGTYIGGCLSRKFIKNINSIEITSKRNNTKLINALRREGYAVSVISLKNNYREKQDLLIVDVKSKNTQEAIKLVKELDPKAFIVVKDTKVVHNGYIR